MDDFTFTFKTFVEIISCKNNCKFITYFYFYIFGILAG